MDGSKIISDIRSRHRGCKQRLSWYFVGQKCSKIFCMYSLFNRVKYIFFNNLYHHLKISAIVVTPTISLFWFFNIKRHLRKMKWSHIFNVQEFDNEGKLAKNPARNTSNWQTYEWLNFEELTLMSCLTQLDHGCLLLQCTNWSMNFQKLIYKYSIVFLNGNTTAVRYTAIRDQVMRSEIRFENGWTLQLAANIPGYKLSKS